MGSRNSAVASGSSELTRIRDLRLVPLALALWVSTIVALYSFAWVLGWVVVGAGVLGLWGVLVPRWPWMRTVGMHVIVAALLVGVQAIALGSMGAQRAAVAASVLEAAGSGARFSAVIEGDPVALSSSQFGAPGGAGGDGSGGSGGSGGGAPGSVAPRGYVIQASLVRVGEMPVRERVSLFTPPTWSELAPGTRVSGFGVFRVQEQPSRSLFSVGVRAPPVVANTDALMEATVGWRNSLRDIAGKLGGGARQLLPGMVVGDTRDLSPALSEDMKIAGLTHLLTVSGANCTYILAFVWLCLRLMRAPRFLASVLGILALAGFVVLVRPEPSVVRAAVMGALGALAIMNGRGRVAFNALVMSVVVLLMIDPWLAIQYGFALSVAATLGLIVLAPALARRLSAWMPGWLAVAISVPLSAQIACTPILLGLQNYVGAYAVVANLLVGIFVPGITVLGILAMVTAQAGVALAAIGVPQAEGAASWFAQVIAIPAGWGTEVIFAVARQIADWPLAKIPWIEGWGGIALALLGLAAVVVWAFGLWPHLERFARDFSVRLTSRWTWRGRGAKHRGGVSGKGSIGIRRTARGGLARPPVAVIAALGAFALAWWLAPLVPLLPGGLRSADVVACDVGQGDGAFVRTSDDSALVFDAGVEPEAMTSCLRRAGVSRVEVLFLTHAHADHIGGAKSVLENFAVGRVVFSGSVSVLQPVLDVARLRGIPVEQGLAGMQGRSEGDAGIVWRVLWPLRALPSNASGGGSSPEGSVENNASLVVRVDVSGGPPGSVTSALFTGDIEAQAAAPLLRTQSPSFWTSIQVLKVAHHGSAGSGTEMIEAIRPRIALISVGLNNDYGHPRPEILSALERVGALILRTDQGGSQLVNWK